MRKLLLILPFLLGCAKDFGHLEVEDGAVRSTVTTAPDTIHAEVKSDAVKIESGAFQGSMTVEKGLELNIPKDAIHVEPITSHIIVDQPAINLAVAKEAVHIVVPPEAIKITLTVAEGAIKPSVSLNVAEGAVVVRGAEFEKGALSVSPWLLGALCVILVLFGVGWLVTKLRQPKKRGMDEVSFWDWLF